MFRSSVCTECVVSFKSIVDKYQLSLIDPRDAVVLRTELDDHCDKLQRSSVGARTRCIVNVLTDDCPVCQALSVHLCRAKLILRFDDRYAVAKFSIEIF